MHLRTNKVFSAHQDPSWYSCHNLCCFCLKSLVCFVAILVVILGIFIFQCIRVLSQRTYSVLKNHNTHLIKHESFKYREDWLILCDVLLDRATLPSDTKILVWKYKPGRFYHYPVVEIGTELFLHGKSFASQVTLTNTTHTISFSDLFNLDDLVSWDTQFKIKNHKSPPQPLKKAIVSLLLMTHRKNETVLTKILDILDTVAASKALDSVMDTINKTMSMYEQSLQKPENHYTNIGLDASKRATYTKSDIERAYRLFVKEWHPDKVQGEKKTEAEVKYAKANQAVDILKNEQKKIAYDARL